MAFKSNLYTTLFLHILYVACKLYKCLTAFNVLREKVPFPKYCHNSFIIRQLQKYYVSVPP